MYRLILVVLIVAGFTSPAAAVMDDAVKVGVGGSVEYQEVPALSGWVTPLSSGHTGAAILAGPALAFDVRLPVLQDADGGPRVRVGYASLAGRGKIWLHDEWRSSTGESYTSSSSGSSSSSSTADSRSNSAGRYTDFLADVSARETRGHVDLIWAARAGKADLTAYVGLGRAERRAGGLVEARAGHTYTQTTSGTSGSGGGETHGIVSSGTEDAYLVDAVEVRTDFWRGGIGAEVKVGNRGRLLAGLGVELPTRTPEASYAYRQESSLTTSNEARRNGTDGSSSSSNTTIYENTETFSPWSKAGATADASLGYSYRGIGVGVYYRKTIGSAAADSFGLRAGVEF